MLALTLSLTSNPDPDPKPDPGPGPNQAAEQRTEGELNLVDLAGSERIKDSQVSGKALEEAKFINKSLTSLGDVISGELTSRRTPRVCPHAPRLARARRLTRHQPSL